MTVAAPPSIEELRAAGERALAAAERARAAADALDATGWTLPTVGKVAASGLAMLGSAALRIAAANLPALIAVGEKALAGALAGYLERKL